MKNVFLGTVFAISTSLYGQNEISSSSVKKMVRTVNTVQKPSKAKKKATTPKPKVYAYLTRVVTSIPNRELKKRKLLTSR